MPRLFALILVVAVTACSAPTTEGPRSLNHALLKAHEDHEVMLGR